MTKKIWKIRIYFIEKHYHSGYYGINVIAKDIFEAGRLAKKRYAKSDYQLIEIQSIVYMGKVDE